MMNKFKVHLIAAARPNFMKIAPLYHALSKEPWADPVIVHTGQHYDANMSEAFFQDLKIPAPAINLGIGSGSHAEQTGNVMIAYEKVLIEERPEMVVVVGDVNSTAACTLAAVKIDFTTNGGGGGVNGEPSAPEGVKRPLVAHLEAGLRSFDRTMPEEINRIVTDALADILWTPSADGDENLLKEGISAEKIKRVGNIMIDSLELMRHTIEKQNVFSSYGLDRRQYGVVTLHRPANVDNSRALAKICDLLISAGKKIPMVFPLHPRTAKNLEGFHLLDKLAGAENLLLTKPLAYIPFMNLVFNCRLVITDSGGVQEETTYLGIPCLTLRPNTERPITVSEGTNQLCSIETAEACINRILEQVNSQYQKPALWDGKTASRIVREIKNAAIAAKK